MAPGKVEELFTSLLVFVGDVVALLTYLPSYLFAFKRISLALKQRAISVKETNNEVVFNHMEASSSKEGTNTFYKDALSVFDEWKIASER